MSLKFSGVTTGVIRMGDEGVTVRLENSRFGARGGAASKKISLAAMLQAPPLSRWAGCPPAPPAAPAPPSLAATASLTA